MENDLKILLEINDKIIAQEIQRILEESDIYTMLVSDNPASSVMGAYTGLNPIETIQLQVHKDDYARAHGLISNSPYKDLLESN